MSALGWIEVNDQTWLARCDARLKLAWLGVLSLASVQLESHEALYALFAITLIVAAGLRLAARTWAIIAALLATITWGTVLSQAMFYGGHPSSPHLTIIPTFRLGSLELGVTLWREGAIFGLVQSLRLVAVTLGGLAVCLSTSPQRLLAALVAVRVPVAVSFMAVAALRFLPTILNEWGTVRRSSRLRGYRPRVWSAPWHTLRMEAALMAPVIAASLRRATTLATSLGSRGFDATRPRTAYPAMRMRPTDMVLLWSLAAFAVALSTLKSMYWLSQVTGAGAESLAPLYAWIGRWL